MNLLTRAISALVGILLLAGITSFSGSKGLIGACGVIILVALNEYRRAAFLKVGVPLSFQVVFLLAAVASIGSLVSNTYFFEIIGLVTSLSLFLALGLWTTRKGTTNEQILHSYGLGLVGIIFCAVFPSMILKTLMLSNGVTWFYSLLVIVFSGDTLAYFGGRFWGKTKLYAQISPKKTIAGAISGAAGSSILGTTYFYWFFPEIPLYVTVPFCLFAGLVAQSGDLFVSLVKRVADVKDTGRLMPGHGGFLDRLDGIFITGPLVYSFSVFVMYFFDL